MGSEDQALGGSPGGEGEPFLVLFVLFAVLLSLASFRFFSSFPRTLVQKKGSEKGSINIQNSLNSLIWTVKTNQTAKKSKKVFFKKTLEGRMQEFKLCLNRYGAFLKKSSPRDEAKDFQLFQINKWVIRKR